MYFSRRRILKRIDNNFLKLKTNNMENLKIYKEQLDKLRQELENDNYDVERDVIDLQEKIENAIEENFDDGETKHYKKLLKELKAIKKEFDFYDEEGELDMMFPNRHDDDFDEDSMNVFGKE
jgi:hypothetical protein